MSFIVSWLVLSLIVCVVWALAGLLGVFNLPPQPTSKERNRQ